MNKLIFLLLLCLPTFAGAYWTSGNELNSQLTAVPSNFYAEGSAVGYITAIADKASRDKATLLEMLSMDEELTPNDRQKLLMRFASNHTCFPKGVTVGQLEAIVKKWLSLHPARWNEAAVDLVEEALRESFPCKSVNDFLK